LQKEFNPDFFIKKENKIFVVEIKSEGDSTVLNKDKLEGAETYFNKLNSKLKNIVYEFHFLQPSDYLTFFKTAIINNKKYVGSLHSELKSKSRAELKEIGFVQH